MIFQYLGGIPYTQSELEHLQRQTGGDPSDIPLLIDELVTFDGDRKYKQIPGNRNGLKRFIENAEADIPMIAVAKQNSLGFDFPAHAVIPVKVEQWQTENNATYFKTFAIDPGTGTMRPMPANFWLNIATYHLIKKP